MGDAFNYPVFVEMSRELNDNNEKKKKKKQIENAMPKKNCHCSSGCHKLSAEVFCFRTENCLFAFLLISVALCISRVTFCVIVCIFAQRDKMIELPAV